MTTFSLVSARAGVAGIAVLFLGLALPTYAADYPFTIRGVVDKSVTTKVVHVTATSASSKAESEVKGVNIGYSITKAKVFKYINGVKKPVAKTQIKLGDEVVMKGTKTGSTFKVDTLVINSRDFNIIGKVREVDTAKKTITVLVAHSTYRNAGIKGKEVKISYNSDTVCKRLGSTVDCSTIAENKQVIKLVGSVTGTNQVYEASKIYDNYKN